MDEEKLPHYHSSQEQWRKLKGRAREMRREPTPAEAALWKLLRNRGVCGARFRRQHSIAGFIADFVCVEQMLVIEVDGDVHEQADQQAYDRERQAALEARGFRVLRFSNAEVIQGGAAVAEVICEAVQTSLPGEG